MRLSVPGIFPVLTWTTMDGPSPHAGPSAATAANPNASAGYRGRRWESPTFAMGMGNASGMRYRASTRDCSTAAPAAVCVDMSPGAALGTISVRDASGVLIYDGTIADDYRTESAGALAVVLAPGPPLTRADGLLQVRDCPPTDCDANGTLHTGSTIALTALRSAQLSRRGCPTCVSTMRTTRTSSTAMTPRVAQATPTDSFAGQSRFPMDGSR